MKIDWKQVWDNFDKWYENKDKLLKCSKCGQCSTATPEWGVQMKQIQKVVNKQLKENQNED